MCEASSSDRQYILGIDLGSASLGWAAVALDQTGTPAELLRAGVRIFDPAVTGDVEKGQDESNAVARRAARLVRRQLRRRVARQRELFRLLQRRGLLPQYEGAEANASHRRHAILNARDLALTAKWAGSENAGERAGVELPLYLLRKTALDGALEPFELGRVFFHLSQRRGYKSNRKEQAEKKGSADRGKKDENLGEVEGDIKDLMDEMRRAGARTLGEYFASLDPHTQKVRRRWTGRKMFEDEFAAIWEKQAACHPALLTEELRHEIKHLLFDQRPVKTQAHLIGGCELEPGERRAAWATLEAQQFRVLQKVNDLEIVLPGQVKGIPLTAEQRQTVLDLLENSEAVTFDKIRKALKLEKNTGFNLQRGGEKRLKGNLTNAHMAEVFAERWPGMSDEEKKKVVEDWRTIPEDESLIRRAMEYWKLDETGAKWLASKPAPSGYCMYSRKAIRKLLLLMAKGMRLKAAEKEIYGNRLTGGEVHNRTPPVRAVLKTLRNPAVERALTELRKVVNALIREHGKPLEVRIELARDLKKPRRERAKAVAQNREREKQRNAAKEKMLRELGPGFEHPSRADVEKALLWEECQGECPYTGLRFPFSSLFGQNPPLQVEHIIPFSRIPDDSFQNKTLCYHEENQHKANRTPFEAYKDPDQYQAILNRVRNWRTPNPGKQRRFELRTLEELEGFTERQLNDTRYASKLACELVGTLYGGRDVKTEDGSRQVVFASSGMVTATLRKGWGLEAILREAAPSANGRNKGKPRTDHRHHAIDAITIALSRPKTIAALSRANAEDPYWPQNGRTAPKIQCPWKDFVPSIRLHIEQMLVSHRPEHRLTGALHDETNYGRPRVEGGKDIVHIRRPVPGLSASDIANIVDQTVRDAVKAKADEYGGDLKKWTPGEGKEDWPQLKTKAGNLVPIKRVRIRKALSVETIAAGERARHVALASNHHVAIFALLDERGRERRWEYEIVSLFDAMDRKRRKQPIVQSMLPGVPEAHFKFSLMWGDTLLLHKGCEHAKGLCVPSFWRVRSIWEQGTLTLVRINDARLLNEIRTAKDWLLPSADTLRRLDAVKVVIDSLGRIHQAGV
ncbi:MAG: type II CRISPR RNA-guided endonuclease Cas9 [Terracidiphilus sp.]